jgi:hypothetical protein
MSYVITEPELVQGAAQDLAGIRGSLAEATANAAGPTTGIAAAAQDEVSTAISALFGDFGQQFHALNAQAQAFHSDFESLLTSGASAYVSAEAANAEQLLTNAMHGGGAGGLLSGKLQTGAQAVAPAAVMRDLNSVGATLATPYEALFSNTATNLQSLGSAIVANPAPLLSQFSTNQIGYGQTIAAGIQTGIQNLPAELANLPAAAQAAVHNPLTINPAAIIQQFVNQQIGYAQTIVTSLQSAAHDFATGVAGLPAAFQAGFQAFAAGDFQGGALDIAHGFGDLFITGFEVNTVGQVFVVTPTGALGDLLPILSVPGQMAQNFSNLIPAGTIPAHIAQNFTNLINTVTDTSVTSAAEFVLNAPDPSGIILTNSLGLPLVLGIGALGGPVNALNAFGSSATSFINAVQTGNPLAAATSLIDAPAVMANGFLNGQSTLPLTLNVGGLITTVNIPLDGILVPAAPYTGSIMGLGAVPVFGTPIGGIVPDLLNLLPEELAAALGGPAPFFPPPVAAGF